jgi:hypothetical protein
MLKYITVIEASTKTICARKALFFFKPSLIASKFRRTVAMKNETIIKRFATPTLLN